VHKTIPKVCLLPVASLLWLTCFHGMAQAASPDTPLELPLSGNSGTRLDAESLSAVTSYQQVIAELETRQSAFGVEMELGQAYYGLGSALQALAQHEEALAAFDMTLQALRENNGLYALEQLPVLQARLDSSQALAAWEDVDASLHLAHEITLHNPVADTGQRYQTLRELGLWKLRAAEEDLLPNALGAAKEVAALYRKELEQPRVRAAYRDRALSQANLYLDFAALEFLQARKTLAMPLTTLEGGQRTIAQLQCEMIQTPDGRVRQVCRNVQVPNMDYFMALSDRKYWDARHHMDTMKEAVFAAYNLLLGEVETQNRDDALALLAEVHRLTGAFNDFVAQNSRKSESRIAAPTGSRISP